MSTQKYLVWLKTTSSEINLKLGKPVLTENDLCTAIPLAIYAELSENGGFVKRTSVTNIPVDIFEHLYQKNAVFRNALKEIHAKPEPVS